MLPRLGSWTFPTYTRPSWTLSCDSRALSDDGDNDGDDSVGPHSGDGHMDTVVETTTNDPSFSKQTTLEPLVQAIVEACAVQRGRSSRNISSYVNARTMVDLIKALGAWC